MQQLLFKTKYLDLIKQGKKTQTIRLWKKRKNINNGDVVIATNFRIKIPVNIIDISQKHISELTLTEAKADGFNSLDSLKKGIMDIYGSLDFVATIIKFKPAQ